MIKRRNEKVSDVYKRRMIVEIIRIAEEDDEGRVDTFITTPFGANPTPRAVRATSGWGWPWIDLRRAACPLTMAHLVSVETLNHNTSYGALPSILQHGLLPGGKLEGPAPGERQHLMLSPYYEGNTARPGARESENVAIFLDVKQLLRSGHLYVCRGNAVVTTWPIPRSFFKMIRWRPTRELIWADTMAEWTFAGMSPNKDRTCPKVIARHVLDEAMAERPIPFPGCPLQTCKAGVWVGQRWCFGCGRSLVYNIPDLGAADDAPAPEATPAASASAAPSSAGAARARPRPDDPAGSSAAPSGAGPARAKPRTDAGPQLTMTNDPAVRGAYVHKRTNIAWNELLTRLRSYERHLAKLDKPGYADTPVAKKYTKDVSQSYTNHDLEVLHECYLQYWAPMRDIPDKESIVYVEMRQAYIKYRDDHVEGTPPGTSGDAARNVRPRTG